MSESGLKNGIRNLKTRNKITKISCSAAISFHLLWLSTSLIVGEGILFGHRYFDEVIRTFSGIEIIISTMSVILILKDHKIGYLLFVLTILSTYIIQLGHRIFLWNCDYCGF